MGIRVQRVFDQARSAMEPGKTIFISKFHHITGHTGEHLLRPTANYMKLKLIGRLPPCEVCAQAKIRQRNIPKKKMKKLPTRPGYRVFIDIFSFKQVSRGGNRHWLIVVDEFSDCTHSFFLKRKSVKFRSCLCGLEVYQRNTILRLRGSDLTTVVRTEAYKKNVIS